MIPSDKCFDLIKKHEGLRLKAYPDPGTGGTPITIGYGSTLYEDGSKIKLGDVITKERALKLLRTDVARRAIVVIADIHPTQLTQNQLDALCSFVYNIGVGKNWRQSTILKKIKSHPGDPTIRDEFAKWRKAGSKILPGLVKRRKEEADLYFS